MSKKRLVNDEIRERKVQVIDENGEKLGVMDTQDAIYEAQSKNLDLVLVGSGSNPKVCKIMDNGKYLFEKKKREKEARRASKALEMKEMRLSPNIAEHDLGFKSRNVRKFIENGNKVKVTMRFRGREIAKNDIGQDIMYKFAEELSDVADIEKKPTMDGRVMYMILSKKK